jgi:hypothetical protein
MRECDIHCIHFMPRSEGVELAARGNCEGQATVRGRSEEWEVVLLFVTSLRYSPDVAFFPFVRQDMKISKN